MKTGIYFRIGGSNTNWIDADWVDLTLEERERVTKDWTIDDWKKLSEHLTDCLNGAVSIELLQTKAHEMLINREIDSMKPIKKLVAFCKEH